VLRLNRIFYGTPLKRAVLIVNVGTPDSPNIRDVWKFLSRFLNDPHVMTIPWLWRKLLVNLVIIPFRVFKSAALYRQLWTENGSPLLFYLEKVCALLQRRLDGVADVWTATSHGTPGIASVMAEMRLKGYQKITVVPLFPQYASSTTGSVESSVVKQIARWPQKPELAVIRHFYSHPLFLKAWVKRIAASHPEQYDHIIFSFHGLPLNHLPEKCRAQHNGSGRCACFRNMEPAGMFAIPACCYKAECYDMARQLAVLLGLAENRYTISFQSRLSKGWLQPFTDLTLKRFAAEGAKVLVVAPSFIADCLETSVELGIMYKNMYFKNNGKQYAWVESLNDQPEWIEALSAICRSGDMLPDISM
jgi:ferrochelatase